MHSSYLIQTLSPTYLSLSGLALFDDLDFDAKVDRIHELNTRYEKNASRKGKLAYPKEWKKGEGYPRQFRLHLQDFLFKCREDARAGILTKDEMAKLLSIGYEFETTKEGERSAKFSELLRKLKGKDSSICKYPRSACLSFTLL